MVTRPSTATVPLRLIQREGPVLRPNADRQQVITYPGGHVWRVNRAHVERVLDAKAAAMMDCDVSEGEAA